MSRTFCFLNRSKSFNDLSINALNIKASLQNHGISQGSKSRCNYCWINYTFDLTCNRVASCLSRAVKCLLFPLHPFGDAFLRNKTYIKLYTVISCIYSKRWTCTFLWKTKWAIETISLNCVRLESISARKLYSTSRFFTEQYLITLDLRAFKRGN